jgi:hypothetical protein
VSCSLPSVAVAGRQPDNPSGPSSSGRFPGAGEPGIQVRIAGEFQKGRMAAAGTVCDGSRQASAHGLTGKVPARRFLL